MHIDSSVYMLLNKVLTLSSATNTFKKFRGLVGANMAIQL